jgi:hypothetical protein
MDFEAAIKLLRAFSAYNPRIYKEFSGFPDCRSQESERGYVLFVDPSPTKPVHAELQDFGQKNNINIVPYGKFLMVSSSEKKLIIDAKEKVNKSIQKVNSTI